MAIDAGTGECEHFEGGGVNAFHHGRQLRLSPTSDLFGNGGLVTLVGWVVKGFTLEDIGQVLLSNPMPSISVRVEISLAVAESFSVAVGVSQMGGNIGCLSEKQIPVMTNLWKA